jgi:hypothetical protein
MLWALVAFFLLLAIVYGAATYEPAGAIMLLLCAAAAFVAVIPLHGRRRRRGAAEPTAHAPAAVSLWPFIIGAGAVLMVDGLVLGLWLLVPGAALVVRGLVGVLGRTGTPAEPPPHPD